MTKKQLIILLVVAILCSFVLSFLFSKTEEQREIKRNEQLEQEAKQEQQIKESDVIPPVLTLKRNKLSIYQGDEINYKAFIKEASDNLDGDLINSVNFNKIDNQQIGTYVVVYTLSDSAGNTTTSDLEITVREKITFSGMD